MKFTNRIKNMFLYIAIIAIAIVGFGISNEALAQKKTGKMSTPGILPVSMTAVSIDIQVTAGATGAPAGFSLQWMTVADYVANGNQWYLSEDPRLCKASFSGNASGSQYNLAPNQSVTVRVGDFLFDNGASTSCGDPLVCGTDYIFRAFAHANSTLNRSDFTANVTKMTLSCGDPIGGCTYTQGYWRTHGPIPTGMNMNMWQPAGNYGSVILFELGNPATSYTDFQWLSIFNTPAAGNGLLSLSHQLMAAKLNLANGAANTGLGTAITDADNLIGTRVAPPVGTGSLSPMVTSGLTSILANYNEGGPGTPGHCP